jgi:hypothetical protein
MIYYLYIKKFWCKDASANTLTAPASFHPGFIRTLYTAKILPFSCFELAIFLIILQSQGH